MRALRAGLPASPGVLAPAGLEPTTAHPRKFLMGVALKMDASQSVHRTGLAVPIIVQPRPHPADGDAIASPIMTVRRGGTIHGLVSRPLSCSSLLHLAKP